MNVYVMRHGTTVWNEKGIIQGRTNNRLSKNGILLTQNVAMKLKFTPIDIIISSPLMRTIQTSNIINQYHKVKVVKDEHLIEIDQGIFKGKSKLNLTEEDHTTLLRNRSKDAGMETYEECFTRVKSFVDNIKKNYNYDNILIVTHGCNATFIENIIKGETKFKDEFVSKFKNAELKKFVI